MKKILLFTLLVLFQLINAQNAGDKDSSFNPQDLTSTVSNALNSSIKQIEIQSDGKIVIALEVATSGLPSVISKIIRYQSNGTLDTSFNIATVSYSLYEMLIQQDGKILICGDFYNLNNTNIGYLARLNSDGTIDTSFNGGGITANSIVRSIALQSNGQIIVAGSFSQYNGTAADKCIRLNTNGSRDTTFNAGIVPFGVFSCGVSNTTNKIVLGGGFSSFNGVNASKIVQLNTDGSIDNGFVTNIGTGFNSGVSSIFIQPDGKILAAGNFTNFDGYTVNRVIRLLPSGVIDTNFNNLPIVNDLVAKIFSDANGKVLIGGNFNVASGSSVNRFLRLDTNGYLDNSINIGAGFDEFVIDIAVQTDGRIIVSGGFNNYKGAPTKSIVRLLASNAPVTNTTNITACSSYTWSINNQTYTTSGTYSVVNGSVTEVLNLTITPSTENTTSIAECNNYYWANTNTTYTQSGIYTGSTTNCVTEKLNLTILPLNQNVTTVSECTSYTWANTGQTYTTSGIYTGLTSNCNTEMLDLTITGTSGTTFFVNGCGSYTWAINGQTYTQTGFYPYLHTPGNGCTDYYLNLTMNNTPTITGNSTQSIPSTGTVGDIVVLPSNVLWYLSEADALSSSNAILNSFPITTSSTYYAVANNGTCASTPFLVNVNLLSNQDFDTTNFSFYPNPTNDIVNIKYSKEISNITVTNLLGQQLDDKEFNSNEVQIDLSNFPTSAYFIKVIAEGKSKIIKIIKE